MKRKNINVIDLFSGCGGLSYGLQKAGFKILLGVDSWSDSLETFAFNHLGAKTLAGDISSIKAKDIFKLVGEKPIDLIVGGPPCQGFSLSGPRNFYDKRNRLYLDFLRLVKELKPKAFLIENVPGLASLFKGQVKEMIIQEFTKLGYCVNAQILDASDYGVPQNRKRIFFVGLSSGKKFEFPSPTHSSAEKGINMLFGNLQKKVNVWDAIGDLPLLKNEIGSEGVDYKIPPFSDYQVMMRRGSKKIYNHIAARHDARTKEIISLVPEGGNYKMLPEHLRNSRNFHVAWTRLHRHKPSPTIDTGHRHHFHPIANRVPTVRESARLQSFPDSFIFKTTKTSQYKQVGNAVPPLLAKAVGKKLRNYF
jgi:DNA (cytosine-5)-methyltransferase 1